MPWGEGNVEVDTETGVILGKQWVVFGGTESQQETGAGHAERQDPRHSNAKGNSGPLVEGLGVGQGCAPFSEPQPFHFRECSGGLSTCRTQPEMSHPCLLQEQGKPHYNLPKLRQMMKNPCHSAIWCIPLLDGCGHWSLPTAPKAYAHSPTEAIRALQALTNLITPPKTSAIQCLRRQC